MEPPLTCDLFFPGMTPLHRAGLGGLASTLQWIETHLPSPFCRKANNFRGLFAFLRPYVATIKFAYTKKIP